MNFINAILRPLRERRAQKLQRQFEKNLRILDEVVPTLKDVKDVMPKAAEELGELCKAQGIKVPPKFKIICCPEKRLGADEHFPIQSSAHSDAILTGEATLKGMMKEPKLLRATLAHELGHILRGDLADTLTEGKLLYGQMVGPAYKAMENSADALGAHMLVRMTGNKQDGMNIARFANADLKASTQKLLTQGQAGKLKAQRDQEINRVNYGTPAQRLDNIRRALRHDAEKHASYLEKLIAERNAATEEHRRFS